MEHKKKISALTGFAIAAAMALSACGGGGGGGSGSAASGSNNSSTGSSSSGNASTGSPNQTVTGAQTTPQYASNSAQLAAFTVLNQYRQQCGFAAFQENTVLDTAAQNHAKYEGLNNIVTDDEDSQKSGYTGVSYSDRATKAGFPNSVFVTGASGGGNAVFPADFVATTAGQQFAYSLLSGVYHVIVTGYPANLAGFGEYETQQAQGAYTYTTSLQSLTFAFDQTQSVSNAPLTFPCSGTTGLPYRNVAEIPTPPNVSATGWGQPLAIFGNHADAVVIQTATLTDNSGNPVALQILNSATDPNKIIPAWEAVAYPTSPLSPNTTYNATVTGTINGTAYSRTWSWSTGNIVG
jgi:hypothetical protein